MTPLLSGIVVVLAFGAVSAVAVILVVALFRISGSGPSARRRT